VRNAVDHGIEFPEDREKAGKSGTGHIKLSARREKNNVIIRDRR
jgi:two-component system chemotaxis sensor kinase CheA